MKTRIERIKAIRETFGVDLFTADKMVRREDLEQALIAAAELAHSSVVDPVLRKAVVMIADAVRHYVLDASPRG